MYVDNFGNTKMKFFARVLNFFQHYLLFESHVINLNTYYKHSIHFNTIYASRYKYSIGY